MISNSSALQLAFQTATLINDLSPTNPATRIMSAFIGIDIGDHTCKVSNVGLLIPNIPLIRSSKVATASPNGSADALDSLSVSYLKPVIRCVLPASASTHVPDRYLHRSILSFDGVRCVVGRHALPESSYHNTVGCFKQLSRADPTGADSTDKERRLAHTAIARMDGQGNHYIEVSAESSLPSWCLRCYLSQVDCNGEIHRLTIVQLVAMFLHGVSAIVTQAAESPISRAVITVPAWYTEHERSVIAHACSIAGLGPAGLINDNIAVALSYYITHPGLADSDVPINSVFVDVSHSGCSVMVVSFTENMMLIKGVASDSSVGGSSIDDALVHHFSAEFAAMHQIDAFGDPKAAAAFWDECQRVKETLSAAEETLFVFEAAEGISYKAVLTRDTFENLISDILVRIAMLLGQALDQAQLTWDEIQIVNMGGGTAEIPSIQQTIKAFFGGKDICSPVSSQSSAAEGALYACTMPPAQLSKQDCCFSRSGVYPVHPSATDSGMMGWTSISYDKGGNADENEVVFESVTTQAGMHTLERSSPKFKVSLGLYHEISCQRFIYFGTRKQH